MAESGGDDKRPIESTEEERKAKTRKKEKARRPVTVEHGKKGKHSTKGDVAGALASSLRGKSKVVRINPTPRVKEFSFSSPPLAEYLSFKSSERFHEWQSHLFHEPTKSAMKLTPKAANKLSPSSLNVPSGASPIKLPSLAESPVEHSKTPSVSSRVSSTTSLMQPSLTAPSEPSKESLPLLKRAITPQSTLTKSVTSATPSKPTLAELPKVTGASVRPSMMAKDSTKLPPIVPRFEVANLPAELPPLKPKKTGQSKVPAKLSTIEISPEKSPEKSPLRKSPTWPPLRIEPQLPPILSKHLSKKPSKDPSATMPPIRLKDSGGMIPLISSGESPSRKRDTMRLNVAQERLQTLQISPRVSPRISPEKAKKQIIKPVNIAEGDPELVSGYN